MYMLNLFAAMSNRLSSLNIKYSLESQFEIDFLINNHADIKLYSGALRNLRA